MSFVFKEARAELRELVRKREVHTPWQAVPVSLAALVPPALFAWAYYFLFSGLRFHEPVLATLAASPTFVAAIVVTVKGRKNLSIAAPARGPLVVAAGLWAASVLALYLADINFRWYMYSYYTYLDLAAYTNVDPSADKGQSYMDSGQIYFRDGSYVAVSEFSEYKSQTTYCVAPILSEELSKNTHATVDFWVVGVNCCNQETGNFTCGATRDKSARSGLRLLRDDVRPFYALAVQAWQAKRCPSSDNSARGLSKVQPLVCPQVGHPLFFHWVQDPLLEVDSFHEKGMSMFGMHVAIFIVGNLVLSLLLFWVLFNLGFK